MKILYVITKSNWGGAQKYVYDLAVAAKGAGNEVAVALGGDGILVDKLRAAEVRVVSVPELGRDVRLLADLHAFRFLKKLFKEEAPDVVHLNSSKIGFLGALAGRRARVPRIVFTAHGWAFNEERPYLARLALIFLYWCTILLSHVTITVSYAVRRQMLPLPLMRGKMTVIHNGLREPTTFLEKAAARKSLGLPPDALIVGTIAELHPVKGTADAIRAVAENSLPIHFAIIGEGELHSDLTALIGAYHAEDRIELLGAKDDAAQYLKAFDIFLLASHSEACPYVLLEAGAARLPVVATRAGGIPEIIKDNETGLLVPPRYPSMIASALKTLAEDPKLGEKLGEHLARHVRNSFSIDRMRNDTIALYSTTSA